MKNNPHSLERKLASYGSMSLALAAVSIPTVASAGAIRFSANLTTGMGQDNAIYFNPLTGFAGFSSNPGTDDFELLTSVVGTNTLIYKAFLEVAPNDLFGNGNNFVASASLGSAGFSSIARLSPGASIGPTLPFSSAAGILASGSYFQQGHWNARPAAGDAGLRMVRGASTFYGWANIVVNEDYTITLNSFGYDSDGAVAIAGEALPQSTPEPASIVLIALGASGIAAWRRKKAVSPTH